MRYQAYLNGDLFFDTGVSSDALLLTDATITLEYGGAGSFDFSIPPQNAYYGEFHKLKDIVSVERDGEEIFYGRVYSISESFNTVQSIECEGILAVLNDTLAEPFTNEDSLEALVETFLELHNSHSDISFEVGELEIEDDYCYRAYENYETTWSRLSDLVDSYGGYLEARHEDDTIYLDWHEDYKEQSGQAINFGENLLDITQESESSEIFTALIPFGADYSVETTTTDDDGEETTESETYTTNITSVNDGLNYIYDEDAVEEFGWIWATNTWSDITEPANLLVSAKEYLAENCTSKVTITVSAVDLANAGESLYHFACGDDIEIVSEPHGIDERFLCTDITFDLLDPSQDKLTLGEDIAGYVKTATAELKATNDTIESISASVSGTLAEAESLLETVTTYATSITQTSEAITSLASQVETQGDQITELESAIEQTAAEISAQVSDLSTDVSSMIRLTDTGVEVAKMEDGEYTATKSVIDDEGFHVQNSSGTELSSFGEAEIHLGLDSTDATIYMCADTGEFGLSNNLLTLRSSEGLWFTFPPREGDEDDPEAIINDGIKLTGNPTYDSSGALSDIEETVITLYADEIYLCGDTSVDGNLKSSNVAYGSGSITLSSGAYGVVNISFDLNYNFSEAPMVWPSVLNSGTSAMQYVKLTAVSTSGFSLLIYNGSSSSATVTYYWLAIGTI